MKFRSQVYTAVSGSIGGITYSHNRGGMYTRGRATPTNPSSPAQQEARNAFTVLAARWGNDLSASNRDEWQTYAENSPLTDAFGEPLVLTGQQMYIRCNSPRLRCGLPFADAGPTEFGTAQLSMLVASFASPDVELEYDAGENWATASAGGLIIQTSRIVPKTRNFWKGPYRFKETVFGNAVPPSGSVAMDTSAFGEDFSFYPGTRVFLRVRASDQMGRLSGVQILAVDLT